MAKARRAKTGGPVSVLRGVDNDPWRANITRIKSSAITFADCKDVVILTAENPQATPAQVLYSWQEMRFIAAPQKEPMVTLFEQESSVIHRDSEEGREQLERSKPHTETETVDTSLTTQLTKSLSLDVEGGLADDDEDDRVMSRTGSRQAEGSPNPDQAVTTASHFNFLDRGSQTMDYAMRDKAIQTEPPPRKSFSENVTQWGIYDAYMKEEQDDVQEDAHGSHDNSSTPDISKIHRPAKILERMINQNIYDDILMDFKYWEDASDELREAEGTLLPLWTFEWERAKSQGLEVTCLTWNPNCKDMFAVGYGSFQCLRQGEGMVCGFTLKNPSWPEVIMLSHGGILCIEFYHQNSQLLAAGSWDGRIRLYEVKGTAPTKPFLVSDADNGKHTGPVWQVRWGPNDLDGLKTLYSVGGDGRVVQWTVRKDGLRYMDILRLDIAIPQDAPDNSKIPVYGCGTALAFHPTKQDVFLVGTEEGDIFQCSRLYTGQRLRTYVSHHLPVYALAWNKFNSDIFMSCSADWNVCIWDQQITSPLLVLDLGCAVNSVVWAPYSSTVFGAVTGDARVHVYDLAVNKYGPICTQAVHTKKTTQITSLAFNDKYPIIIIGDDKGVVHSLKLSPNLRRMPKEAKGAEPPRIRELESLKVERLLALLRDPDSEDSKKAAKNAATAAT